jgi:S-adenosylhomocysteine hydrolase
MNASTIQSIASPTATPVRSAPPGLSEHVPYACRATLMADLPLMHYTTNALAAEGGTAFAGLRVVMLLHALGNAVAFADSLVRLGADPSKGVFFFKDYRYKNKDEVLARLQAMGFKVWPIEDCDRKLGPFLRTDGLPILYVVDGAYPAIHGLAEPDLRDRTIGVVEQTRKGIRRLQQAFGRRGPACPVISLPDSQIKSQFEPPHIARAIMDSLADLLLAVTLARMTVAVLGAGAIGGEVVTAAVARGCAVNLYDPSAQRMVIMSSRSARLCRSAAAAVADATMVIGTSGECSITPEVVTAMRNGTYVVSASSDRVELDWAYLNNAATATETIYRNPNLRDVEIGTAFTIGGTQEKKIRVLGNGMPLNFMSIGMADDSADLVMSMLLAAAHDLTTHAWDGRSGILTTAMDRIAERHRLAETYLNFI